MLCPSPKYRSSKSPKNVVAMTQPCLTPLRITNGSEAAVELHCSHHVVVEGFHHALPFMLPTDRTENLKEATTSLLVRSMKAAYKDITIMVLSGYTTSGVVKRSRPCTLLSFQLGSHTHRKCLAADDGACNRYADDTLAYSTSLKHIALHECMHICVYKQIEVYHYDNQYNAT